MKLLVAFALLGLASCTFVEFLESLQHHHSFQRLPEEEKLLFGQLIVAAEEGTLEAYIDSVGLVKVISLVDHMSTYDAQKFEAYLAEHLNYTHHNPGNVGSINKRNEHEHVHTETGTGAQAVAETDPNWDQFSSFLQSIHGTYYDRLPEMERKTYYDLSAAAQHGNVSQYIEQVGYGPIFGLLEYLDYTHANELYNLLEAALGGTTAVKRDGRDENEFHGFLTSLHSQYYERLPEPERQTLHGLTEAARTSTVTAYIDQVGYGAIFGLLEHLDAPHAAQVEHYIQQHLEAEAPASTVA